MATLKVPHSFFVKERNLYDGWQVAVFREFFQNSTDPSAGSSRINVNITSENGMTKIVFSDDGKGMTRHVLENVYFVMGESSKGAESTGGFGMARTITNFSMERYEIETNDCHVIGSGAEYIINDLYPVYRGCKITIYMKSVDGSVDDMIQACHEYLTYSWIDVNVYINNVRWTNWLKRGRLTRDLVCDDRTFASVYVNKSGNSVNNHYMVIRVSGACMYRRYIKADASVLVEIEPSINREVLVANRDSMNRKYRSVLDDFIDEISADSKSALKDKIKRKTTVIRSGGCSTIRVSASKPNTVNSAKEIHASRSADLMEIGSAFNKIFQSAQTRKLSTREIDYRREHRTAEERASSMPFDVFLIDDTDVDDTAIRAAIDDYNPKNWGRGLNKTNLNSNVGSHKQKLLFIWYIICRSIAEDFCKKYELEYLNFTVGWTFGSALAQHRYEDGVHIFLLNPLDKDGNSVFSIRDKNDLRRLIAYARHEIAHIEYSWHNEEFAGLMTELTAITDEKEIMKLVMEYLKGDKE